LGVKGVELLVSDDHGGLKAAVARHIQGASWQRCQVHYARNLLGMVGAKKRKELAAKLRAIFAATSREQVLAQYPQEACVWCTERRGEVIDFWVAFSDEVVVIDRRLIREGWTRYRWESRPSRRP
jgi:transposase-like protein